MAFYNRRIDFIELQDNFLEDLFLGHDSTLFESKSSAHFTNSRIFKPLPRKFSTRNVGASFPRDRS